MLHTTEVQSIHTSEFDGVQLAVCDDMAYYLTSCCQASAKGCEFGTACRACYSPIDDWMGDAAMTDDIAGMRRMLGRVALPAQVDEILAWW
jgi:hypothetical protein